MTNRFKKKKRVYATWMVGLLLTVCVPSVVLAADDGEAVIKKSDCMSCHAVDHKLVGPAFQEIAKKYAAQEPQIIPTLMKKVKEGGSGNWGEIPMTPHPQLSDADLKAAVTWILSQKPAAAAAGAGKADAKTTAASGKTYTYKNPDGKEVTTDFQVYTTPAGPKVTEDVFKGYETYNSYCFRCHGGDAVGGDIAPDLRDTLGKGMTWETFLSTAMAGRVDKGMPSWAGFFEEKDLRQIYDYIKGRQLDLVPAGRPPSDQD